MVSASTMPSSPSIVSSSEPHVPISVASAAEPGPFWPEAKKNWGIAWEFHWAGFGFLFSILAVRSFLALAQVKTQQGFGRKPLFIAINTLLLTLGTTRALSLFLDPYSSGDNGVKIPSMLGNLLFGIAYPCLTSAFCLIHLAFLQVAKIQIAPKKIQNVRFVAGIITIHFVLQITAGVLAVNFKRYSSAMLITCRSFFVIWGSLLSAGFIYSGLKVIRRAGRVQNRLEMTELGGPTAKASGRRRNSRTSKVGKVTFVTSILGLVCCALQLYARFGIYGVNSFRKTVNPPPWPWLVFQTCFRLVEFCMACTIAYSVLQRPEPQNINHRNDNK